MSNAGFNPYQAPQAPLVAQIVPGDDVWQDGRLLVLRKGAVLPDRCVKCNAPAEGYRLKRTLYWHPWPVYLTIFISVLIYIIIALVVRNSLVTEIGLCPRHRSRRSAGIAILVLLIVLSIVGFASGIGSRGSVQAPLLIASGITMVAALIIAVVVSAPVRAKKIDAFFGWLKGVCPEYLAELPPSPVDRRGR